MIGVLLLSPNDLLQPLSSLQPKTVIRPLWYES